jgi:LmbE family N-acetylglucosaminyl deacetylase
MLSFLEANGDQSQPVVIVSPHPDDEIIGAGTRLPFLKQCTTIEVTDGSPPSPGDAIAAGYSRVDDYASARMAELREALELTGRHSVVELGFSDQRASLQMIEIAEALREQFSKLRPSIVLTVPYEGGHPDHDATAFAVHQAVGKLDAWARPAIVEMLSYHHANGRCEMKRFLGEEESEVLRIPLSEEDRIFKRKLFECFRTQQRVLCWFQTEVEKFRLAPSYDFNRAPHEGKLYYEMFPWGMDGERWRTLALKAMASQDSKSAV